MVELLIRVQDKLADAPSKAIEVKRMHRGDVVVWKSDGWPWSEREKANPAWRIVRVDLTNTEADALVSPEDDISNVKAHRRKRIRSLDLDSIGPGLLRAFLDDDTRKEPIFDATGSAALFAGITELKATADSVVV